MIKSALGFLSDIKGYLYIAGGLLLIASLSYAYHALTVSSLESDLAAEVKARSLCQASVTKLEAAAALQNAAIDRFAEGCRAGETRAEAAAEGALRRAESSRRREQVRGTGPEAMNAFFKELME